MKLGKRLKNILILSLGIGIVFTSCGTQSRRDINEEFKSVLDSVNKEHEDIYSNPKGLSAESLFEEQAVEFSEEEKNITLNEYTRYLIKYSYVDTYKDARKITEEEAMDDIDFMFRFFKGNYGMYNYLGGDEVFEEAKADIIESLKDGNIDTAGKLNKLIREELSFIKDGHFLLSDLNGMKVKNKESKYIYAVNRQYLLDDKGYYFEEDGDKKYLISVDGDEEIDKYIRRSINEDGELCHILISKRSFSGHSVFMNVNHKSGDDYEEREERFTELKGDGQNYGYRSNFEFKYIEEIPYMRLYSFIEMSQSGTSMKEFMDSSSKIKKSPVAILDLRDNIGGSPEYAKVWIKNYLGYDMNVQGASADNKNGLRDTIYEELYGDSSVGISVGSHKKEPNVPERAENDRILFVLVNKNAISAAELFIEDLMNIENVVIVGSNTSGGVMGAGIVYTRLPKTGILMRVGHHLYMPVIGEEFELNGYEADIVVNPEDALNRTVKMIQNYKLR